MERDVHFACKSSNQESAEKLQKISNEHGKRVAIFEETTVGICRVCDGNVVSRAYSEFNPMTGPPVIGPGSQNQFVRVESFYCAACGVKYEFPPPLLNNKRK